MRDISQESTREVIPDSLYWLICLIISPDDNRCLDRSSVCTNMVDERQVLSIAQDVIHCCTNGRVKLPKHTSLAMCVFHLTSSRNLLTLLNRMGHCCSYDEMRAVDTSIVVEVLAHAEEHGTVIPSNISPGPLVQIAADNNDFIEETLDGKNTTHATTMVVYQRKVFSPAPPPKVLADHATRRRSLQTTSSLYEIQEYSAHGRRPAVFAYIDQVKQDWYKGDNEIFSKASRTDVIWELLRLHPTSFREAFITEIGEKQVLPSWSGFNAILFPDRQQESNIDYCPMIDGDSTEFSTVYTVLKHAQKISTTLGQEDTVITFDLLIYMKAKQIQFRFPDEFSDVVIRLGGFHIALNFLSLIGKKYLNSGLDDLFIESGEYAAGTTSALMKGKSYNRGVRTHKLAMEAFFRLMWISFVQWYNVCRTEVQIEEEGLLLMASMW